MATENVLASGDVYGLIKSARKGIPLLIALKREIDALPYFKFPGRAAEDDDSVVLDSLAATELVMARLKGLPVEALAVVLADYMLHDEGIAASDMVGARSRIFTLVEIAEAKEASHA